MICDICDYPMTDVTLPLCFVTCVTIIYNVISYSLPKSKIKKSKNKNQKIKQNKIKPSPLFTTLTSMVIICWSYKKYINFRIS